MNISRIGRVMNNLGKALTRKVLEGRDRTLERKDQGASFGAHTYGYRCTRGSVVCLRRYGVG